MSTTATGRPGVRRARQGVGRKALAAGTETGRTEEPDGATSYLIVVDENARTALRALKPGEQSWFAMEQPDKVRAATITLTDGVVTES